jgi:hypothetical protein
MNEEIKFVLFAAPRFERTGIYAFNDREVFEKVTDSLKNMNDDYYYEEVDEKEAKMHYQRKDQHASQPALLEYLDLDYMVMYPNWEQAKEMMCKASKNYYEWLR